MSKRETLKGYFQTGAIPTAAQFAELIDSALIFDDDAIRKLAGDPLSIKPVAADASGTLIKFYRIENGGTRPSWQLRQQSAENKAGLSIADAAGVDRLFIDSGTGVGIGTADPAMPGVTRSLALGRGPGGIYGLAETENPWGLSLVTEGQARLAITADGKVGIGTSEPAPGLALDVRGKASIGDLNVNGRARFYVMSEYLDLPGAEKDYMTLPLSTIDLAQAFTIEVWVYYQSNCSGTICHFSNGDATNDVFLYYRETETALLFGSCGDDPTRWMRVEGVVETKRWMHLAVTIDASGVARIYKNGRCVGADGRILLPNAVSRTGCYLGHEDKATETYFNGRIRELRIWKGVRTPEQLARYCDTPIPAPFTDLIAYYPLDLAHGTNDLGPSGCHGILNGDATIAREDAALYVNGKAMIDEASIRTLQITGKVLADESSVATLSVTGRTRIETSIEFLDLRGDANSYMKFPDMGLKLAGGFTLEVWAYYRVFNSSSRIFDLGNGQAKNNILFCNRGTSNDLVFQVFGGAGGGVGQTLIAAGVLDKNIWMHLAVTLSATGVATLYKNGVSIATGTITCPVDDLVRTSCYVGRSNWGDAFFDGRLHELRIWKGVRTAQQLCLYRAQRLRTPNADLIASRAAVAPATAPDQRLDTPNPELIAYYPFDVANQARDLGPSGWHGTLASSATIASSTQTVSLSPHGVEITGDVLINGKPYV